MKQIQLSQNQVALVDDADFPLLSDFKWAYRAERNGNQGYAVRHWKVDGKDRLRYLHRQIMDPPPGMEVIFLNYNRPGLPPRKHVRGDQGTSSTSSSCAS
jgi:hypothetical protein